MAEEREGKNPVQSAERIFQVMETLADHGEMGLMELSTALDLHKSTVHRLLMSLIYMGYAKQDEATQKYMLSYKVVNMAGKILERMDILQVAKPYMERLSDLSGEAVHLVQRGGQPYLIYIQDRGEGRNNPHGVPCGNGTSDVLLRCRQSDHGDASGRGSQKDLEREYH